LKIEIYTQEIPSIFARFKSLIGDEHWRKRVKQIEQEIRGNPFLRDYLLDENSIAFGLDLCSKLTHRYSRIPIEMADRHLIYPCISFAAQILSVIDMSSPNQARQLVRRIHGALKNPDDIRALQFELTVATHFTKRGDSVSWQEINGTGTMDFVINNLGSAGLEVECKLISHDKGRKIHRREALEFHHLLASKLKSVASKPQLGLSVVLTVDDRLPKAYKDRKKLADVVLENLLTGHQFTKLSGANLRIFEFDMGLLSEVDSEGLPLVTHSLFNQITQTNNREVMMIGRKSAGAVAFVIQSSNDDKLLPYIFDTLAKSANKQLSKNRAGIFLVGLHGIEKESLVALSEQDFDQNQPPTALQQHVSDFLSSQNRDHVVGVGFLSKTRLQDNASYVSSDGSAYMFPKKESPFWDDDFAGLFNE